MLEADLHQYANGFDYRDLFDRSKPRVTARLVANLAYQLPDESRLKKRMYNTRLDTTQHLLFEIIDVLNQATFQTSIVAAGTVGKEYRSAQDDAPKRIKRPVFVEAKPRFMTTAELRGMLSGKDRITIEDE